MSNVKQEKNNFPYCRCQAQKVMQKKFNSRLREETNETFSLKNIL